MPPKARMKVKFSRDSKTYESQPTETARQWLAFTIYKDMGAGRTLAKAATAYREHFPTTSQESSTYRVMQGWSSKWHWVDRINEYDRFIEKKKRQKAVHAVEQMRDRHIKLGNSLQVLGAQELQKWILRAQKDPKIRVTVADLLRAIETGIKLERLSRGEPETVHEERQAADAEQTREALVKILEDDKAMEALDTVMHAAERETHNVN